MANRLGAMVSQPPISGSEVAVAEQFVPAAQVLMFHFGRGVRTFGATCLLLSNGFTQDAVILARTLLEVLFEMAFIARFPEDAHYYFTHALDLEKRFQRNWHAYSPARTSATEVSKIKQGEPADHVSGLSHGAWHPKHKSVRSRAKESGIPQIYYDLFYSLASRYSHGSGDWLREIARKSNKRIEVSYEGDRMEHDLVLLITCDTFLQILIVANAALGLKARDVLRKTHEDLTNLVGCTWDTLFKDPTSIDTTNSKVMPDGA
jgi:hypothetical protein